jgi:hypothetical protein
MVNRLMSFDEKFAVWQKSWALSDAGRKEEALELDKTVPVPPFLAKFLKERGYGNFLVEDGWNLAEVEAEFGKDWLTS